MGKLIFNMSMSLDGFVAGPNDEVDQLFKWYISGDTDFPFPGSDLVFKVSRASAGLLQEASRTVGAIVTGRRNFDGAGAWGGKPPPGCTAFCRYPSSAAGMGQRGIAVHIRHGRR